MKNSKKLQSIIDRLETMKDELETLIEKEEEARDLMQDEYDEKSEKWQESDAGNAMYERLETWDSSIDSMNQAKDSIDEALSTLGYIEME